MFLFSSRLSHFIQFDFNNVHNIAYDVNVYFYRDKTIMIAKYFKNTFVRVTVILQYYRNSKF